MFKYLFSYFLIIHMLGDFYFHNEKLPKNKSDNYNHVVLHNLAYLSISFACIIPVWSVTILIYVSILAILHYIVDSIIFFYIKLNNKNQNSAISIIDQLIHIVCMAIAASIFTYMRCEINLLSPISNYLSAILVKPVFILEMSGFILAVHKPANTIIKQLIYKYKPTENEIDSNKAGAFIGTLERIIIILLLNVGQYSAIGLVMTAKSIDVVATYRYGSPPPYVPILHGH